MRLDEIIIFNYKSCRSVELSLSENTPNIFIGLNDSGKSTILQAVDLLLGEKPKFNSLCEGNYKTDFSNSPISIYDINIKLESKSLPSFEYDSDVTLIIGKLSYSEEEKEEFAGLGLSTQLNWSIESNDNNFIWYAKKFSSQGQTAFLIVSESTPRLCLWDQNQTELNKKIKELGISNEEIINVNGEGRFSNLEKIKPIYSKMECSNQWTEYKFSKNDKDIFPIFNLFDWDTSLDEINNIATAIMKDEIDIHLKPIKEEASRRAIIAEMAINEKFGEISKVISEVAKGVESITSKIYFDVKEKISDIMLTKSNSDDFIHLENQGEGLKRQIWFSLIKAKASESLTETNKFIWAFDEPETHLHPSAQRDFFDIINKVTMGNVQSIISTHSTIFIDKSNLNNIRSVKQNHTGYTEINSCKNTDSIYSSLNIKNSDFLFYNKFLIVEGDTEQHLIPKLYELYTNRSLLNDNIQLINIHGKDKWFQNKKNIDSILDGFQKTEDILIYLFDNDMSFQIGATARIDNMFFVGDQDIEDSIKDEVWLNILNDFYKEELIFIPSEIRDWKDKVLKGQEGQKHEKFYHILEKGIKQKCKAEHIEYDSLIRIPSKGVESADFLIKFILTSEDIPEVIINAFKKLNAN